MASEMLNQKDVARLLQDPTPEVRIKTANKVAGAFDPRVLSDKERVLAEEIFRLMVRDAEVRVRKALSDNLKDNSAIPHDVAVNLAADVDEVALPVIEFSDVLSDADLIAIVEGHSTGKQMAVASRAHLSEQVSDALVDTGNEDVVTRLVANDGAKISDATFQRVVDDFGENEGVQSAMIGREHLPVTVLERLVTVVSDNLRGALAERKDLPESMATDLVLKSRERAVIGLSSESQIDDVILLVKQLHDHGRLTPSIILRAICMGDMTFFECAMAKLSDLSLENARRLINDQGPLGLRAIYDKARLPPAQYMAVRAAVNVSRETEMDGRENDQERYARRMIERIMTQYDDLGVQFERADLEYLLKKIDQLPPCLDGDDLKQAS